MKIVRQHFLSFNSFKLLHVYKLLLFFFALWCKFSTTVTKPVKNRSCKVLNQGARWLIGLKVSVETPVPDRTKLFKEIDYSHLFDDFLTLIFQH
jgi:hypothetical protein